ncbi:hypothetical protein M0R36_07740 [bacterium]|jgi:hypothetical protein|nr:hypothetical protein [bacterium]
MNDIERTFAVLVVSCDKYADLWKPFFQLFWQFWPDCPTNVYLLTNEICTSFPRVKNLLIGKDISWSDNLRKAILELDEKYIFLFIDDLFLYDFVNASKVLEIFKWILKSNPNYIRMNPTQKPDSPYNELVGSVSKGTIYRTSTVLSVWKKNVLLDLLKQGESAWDFEVYGSVRSDVYEGFYSTWSHYFPVINCVVKAKWQRSAIRKFKRLGINIDLTKREKMNCPETILSYFKYLRSGLLNMFPARYRRRIKDIVLNGKYDYKIK